MRGTAPPAGVGTPTPNVGAAVVAAWLRICLTVDQSVQRIKADSSVTKLSSFWARQRLNPLVSALEARPGGDYHQLARMARDVATTRA